MNSNELPFPPLQRTVYQERIAAYADVSGDHNPLHLDPAFAAGSQFGGIVAHGMVLYGFLCDAMKRVHPQQWEASGSIRARFRAPARPGDVVTITGTRSPAAPPTDAGEGMTVRYALECRNRDGEILATANAEVTIVSDEPSGGKVNV